MWEPFVTPSYVEALLVDGLLKTLQMAFTSVIARSRLRRSSSGSASSPTTPGCAGRAGLVVEFFRAVPVLLLMIFIFFTYGVGGGGIGSYWSVVIALTLYNGAVLAEVFRAGILAVPRGPGARRRTPSACASPR